MTNEIVKEVRSKLNVFQDDKLNDIGAALLDLNEEYSNHLHRVKQEIRSAFRTRWEYGKLISENLDYIKEQCGSQKEFAKAIGESESVISNNKRGYEDLLDKGCETYEEVVDYLKQKEIRPTVRNFEKIGTLLNNPDKDTKQKEQTDKDLKRLEELRSEAQEILRRNEPMNKPQLVEDAFEFIEDIDDIEEYLNSFDPYESDWKSEKYLEFVRNFGVDLITMEPTEKCDPHHTNKTGGTGGQGKKLPDYCCIPVSRQTHTLIGAGIIEPTPEEILEAQFVTLTTFLKINMK